MKRVLKFFRIRIESPADSRMLPESMVDAEQAQCMQFFQEK